MYEVRVEDSFAAAHFIKEYHGKCENLHGHNYKVRVFARSQTLGKGGMLFDFTLLKKHLKTTLEELDHHHLNEIKFFKINEPSAERIAEYIYMGLVKTIPECPISKVEVFETEKNLAAYIPD